LQHEVETRIGRSLLAGNIEDGSTITVAEIGGRIGRHLAESNVCGHEL